MDIESVEKASALMSSITVSPASSATTISFWLSDIRTNRRVSSLPVMFWAHNFNTGVDERTTEYTSDTGAFAYRLAPGNWVIEFRVFNTSTNQFYYYSKNVINIQSGEPTLNKSFYLTPVGSIDGKVVDVEGNPVSGAGIDFPCTSNLRYDAPSMMTNQYGAFHLDIAPVGDCQVFSAKDNFAGDAKTEVFPGQTSPVMIRLDTVVRRSSSYWLWRAGGVLLLLLVLAVIFHGVVIHSKDSKAQERGAKRKEAGGGQHAEDDSKEDDGAKKEGQEAPAKLEKGKDEADGDGLSRRAKDILATLSEREAMLVTYLLEHGHEATQARLRNGTMIPKTSLVRLFRSLEEKKIISLETNGSIKKIKLTAWFIEKD